MIGYQDQHQIQYLYPKQCNSSYRPNEDELAILLYTSGTTGDSKGVMLSQKNVIINAFQADKVQRIQEHDKFLSVLPLSHTYENTLGLILPILKGASVSYLRKPPTASVLVPAMQKVKPELMLTVPMIIEKVFKPAIDLMAVFFVLSNFLTLSVLNMLGRNVLM